VLGLVLVFCVVFFALAVILWAGTLGFQGLIYNEPASGLYWRGPLAGAALTLFVALWCVVACRSFDPTTQTQLPLDTLTRFQTSEAKQLDKFWSVTNNQEILFRKRNVGAYGIEYRDEQGNPWRKSDTAGIVKAILIEDDNKEKARFEPKLTPEGTFQRPSEPNWVARLFGAHTREAEAFPGYYEVGGRRSMDALGRVSVSYPGRWFLNILFNSVHLGIWFVCLWLLLRFQWPHALGLAIICWVVMTLVTLPMLFDRARDLAKERGRTVGRSARIEIRLPQPECRMCMMSPSLTT
jgi:hypothetical protein